MCVCSWPSTSEEKFAAELLTIRLPGADDLTSMVRSLRGERPFRITELEKSIRARHGSLTPPG